MKSQNSLMINSNLGVNDTSNSSAGDLDNDSDFFRLFDLDDVDNRGMSGQPENKSDHVDQPTVEQNQLQEQKSSIELDSQYHNHPLEAVIILDDNNNNAKSSRQEVVPSDTNEFIESMKTLEIDNDETHYRPGITLRKRKDIQLHPFTIEKNKFKSLLKGSSITKVVSSVEPTITEDQSDTEFVPDAREEEDPSLPIDCTQSALDDDSQPKEVMRIDSHNPRSVSPEAQKKEKKIVTYSKKRRTKATSSSHREKLKEKIFEAKRLEEELGPFVDILEHKPMSHNQQNNPSQSTLFSSLDFLKDHDNNDAELMLVDDNEDEQPVFLHRRRLRRRIESDEDDDDDEEEQLQPDNHDSIFDFPESVESLTGGYTSRKIIPAEKNENDVVPVIDDEFEYRPAKRRRVKVADLRKNKNILKGVLPASFLKVYERELNEEEKRSTSRTARHSALRKRKSDNNKKISTLDQPFDAFLGSQSEFNEDRSSEQYDSYRYASSTRPVHEKMHSKSQSSRSIHRTRIDEYFNHDTEAIEDNRIPNRQSTVQVRKTSQVSTQRPASKAKKKRKRPRRTMDDIYIHPQPKARTHLSQHRSFQQTLDDMSISSKRAYNDGHFTVQRPSVEWVRNVAEYLRSTKNAASLRPIPKYTLSLEEVVEKIQRVFDPDLRCSVRLKNTVYLHHRLLQPLLSTQPNSKRAYAHLKSSFENPVIFHRRIFWTDIGPDRKELIQSLFKCASKLIADSCSRTYGMSFDTESDEIPDLDMFCVFVSVYLTQWLPLQEPMHATIMTQVFGEEIRAMANYICHIVKSVSHTILSWKLIVKTMIFILDWSCRLHLIGINESEWSVSECTQMLIDILVMIGHECITSQEKSFVIEAWICLLQIMTVSSSQGGYYFSGETFMSQLKSAIGKQKGQTSSWIVSETDLQKETWWTNALTCILEKYMS
ncbi:hypothetical protein CU097_002184 [Rhizopus azygosporus]|uniref:Uncharacterized protein n=1 Tax=Rhizopus azygosporus TaxID=86630 RepID=A0A367KB41_RHIAZ|nr:hypothetical protein CU097_002184 [Rhizopus azygosporus]